MPRMDKKELVEVGKWKDKALAAKGGVVGHVLSDKAKGNYDQIKWNSDRKKD